MNPQNQPKPEAEYELVIEVRVRTNAQREDQRERVFDVVRRELLLQFGSSVSARYLGESSQLVGNEQAELPFGGGDA